MTFAYQLLYQKSDLSKEDIHFNLPEKYIPYISYFGNDLYYFFDNIMYMYDEEYTGIIMITQNILYNILPWNEFYEKTKNHFCDFSDEFKEECNQKYTLLYELLIYLHINYPYQCFFKYRY